MAAGADGQRAWLVRVDGTVVSSSPAIVADRGIAPRGGSPCGTEGRQRTDQSAEIRDLIDTTRAKDAQSLFMIEEEYRLALLDAESAFRAAVHRPDHDPETGWGLETAPPSATAG